MSRRGDTPSPTPSTTAITELTLNGTSILDESSSVNVSVRRPTLHVKVQRTSLDEQISINFDDENLSKRSTFNMPSDAYIWEDDITSQADLANNTYTVALYGTSIMPIQTCGSIVVNL